MKVTINNNEYDVRNPAGVEYIRNVFLATMKARHGDQEKVEGIIQDLVKGKVPQRGAKGGFQKERTTILRGLLQSAGIDAELRSNEGKSAAMIALAQKQGKTVEDLETDIQDRAEKMRELATA